MDCNLFKRKRLWMSSSPDVVLPAMNKKASNFKSQKSSLINHIYI